MLETATLYATLPAQKLDRARSFYEEKLGLKPAQEGPEGLRYECAGANFLVFESSGEPSGTHTQVSWVVPDLEATVDELRRNGVIFQEYDLPGFKTVDGIADVGGQRGAWFKDSEGNLLAVGDRM